MPSTRKQRTLISVLIAVTSVPLPNNNALKEFETVRMTNTGFLRVMGKTLLERCEANFVDTTTMDALNTQLRTLKSKFTEFWCPTRKEAQMFPVSWFAPKSEVLEVDTRVDHLFLIYAFLWAFLPGHMLEALTMENLVVVADVGNDHRVQINGDITKTFYPEAAANHASSPHHAVFTKHFMAILSPSLNINDKLTYMDGLVTSIRTLTLNSQSLEAQVNNVWDLSALLCAAMKLPDDNVTEMIEFFSQRYWALLTSNYTPVDDTSASTEAVMLLDFADDMRARHPAPKATM